MKGKLLFEEIQYFKESWRYYLVSGLFCLLALGMLYFISIAPSDQLTELYLTATFSVSTFGLVWWAMFRATLIIKIDESHIYYSFFPFIRTEKCLTKSDIKQLMIIKYHAMRDHRGHGYKPKLFSKKLALTIAGNKGLSIELTNGKKLVLGSQKHEALKVAINQLRENWQQNY